MKYQIIIISFLALLLFGACTEKIELDLNSGDNLRLVVDALLTTEEKAHLVKLSLSKDYFKEGESDAAQNATVSISDGSITENLVEQTPGSYYTSETFKGEENKTYTLRIEYEGEVYTSTSTILPVAPIDSITYEFMEAEEEDEEDYYSLFASFQEPSTINQYYMWKLDINGVYYTDSLAKWLFTEDALVNGNYIANVDFFDFEAEPGDIVTFEQYSITKEALDNLNAILLETEFRGGLFDGAPANIKSNIDNGALGLFITADIEKKSIVIE